MSLMWRCKLKYTGDDSSHILTFQVIDGDVRPLLSSKLCQRLNFLKVLVKNALPRMHLPLSDYVSQNELLFI